MDEITGCWYVKLPGSTVLVERAVVEQTELTVLLEDFNSVNTRYNKTRYKIEDVEFVEAF